MAKTQKPTLSVNLLKPQESPEKLHIRFWKWLLSSGRYIVVFVELIVLTAFVGRFKLDADLARLKEEIEQQIPFIESLAADERLIRRTQLQISTINQVRSNPTDFTQATKKLAQQTPSGVTLFTVNFEKGSSGTSFRISGTATTNRDLNTFIYGLKDDGSFTNLRLENVSLELGVIHFTVGGNIGASNKS